MPPEYPGCSLETIQYIQDSMSKIENALKAATETRTLRIGPGILREVHTMFREQFPGRSAVVIADRNTFRAAGKDVSDLFREQGIIQKDPFIFEDPRLTAEYSHVDRLVSFLGPLDAIPVAVGSGTINDLTKLSSFLTGRSYLCVATAASMDGYTSYGASVTAGGAKQTFSCPAPRACLADTGILVKAPPEMVAAGYADLFAKITAGADWILASHLEVEPIDEKAWSIVQGGLRDALSDPAGLKAGNQEAFAALTEGLMLGGFAMQWSRTSRPASGAEHQFSHLWNMEHHTHRGEPVSHGFQVSIATLAILAFYECLLESPVEQLNVNDCCSTWPLPEQMASEARRLFQGTDFPEIGLRETSAKYIPREALADQLHLFLRKWPRIKRDLEQQLVPLSEAQQRLKRVGAPVEPEEIGISRARLRETFIRAQFIRRRFTILDLAVRTNLTEKWLNRLFGTRGIWEIESTKKQP